MWVPPSVTKELVDERKQFEVELMGNVKQTLEDFNRELQRIDPYLQLVKAMDDLEPGTPLRPGFYHVIRHNPGAPPSVMTVEGPDGEFVEPNSSIYDMLKLSDLQNPAVGHLRRQRKREMEEAKEKRLNEERNQRQSEAMERWIAGTETSVSMLPGWSQNVKGRRGTG